MVTANEVIAKGKEQGVEIVDFRFCDLPGLMQHFSAPLHELTADGVDEGRPIEPLVAAFWIVAEGAASDWTAAAWCMRTDPALKGASPVAWARAGKDPELLLRIARQDAARLSQ